MYPILAGLARLRTLIGAEQIRVETSETYLSLVVFYNHYFYDKLYFSESELEKLTLDQLTIMLRQRKEQHENGDRADR